MRAAGWLRRSFVGLAASVLIAPAWAASAAEDAWCVPGLGGVLDASGRCSLSLVSRANAHVDISISLPVELLDDPTAGPVLQDYALERGRSWRHTAETLMRNNSSSVEPTVYSHSSTVKSVVLHERFHTHTVRANDAYRTFTFDLQNHRLLALNDLFAPGVEPLTAVPPLARPYVEDALTRVPPPHLPDVYPFIAEKWEAQPDGSGFSDNYRAFALTKDELVLYMPGQPMQHEIPPPPNNWQWAMEGGTVIAHIPLSVLKPILSERFTQ